jgi:hypothetical protein
MQATAGYEHMLNALVLKVNGADMVLSDRTVKEIAPPQKTMFGGVSLTFIGFDMFAEHVQTLVTAAQTSTSVVGGGAGDAASNVAGQVVAASPSSQASGSNEDTTFRPVWDDYGNGGGSKQIGLDTTPSGGSHAFVRCSF